MDFLQLNLISLLRYLLILVFSYLVVMVTFPYLVELIRVAGLVRPNYRGEKIPAATGVVLVVLLPLITAIGMILSVKSFTTINSFLFLVVIIGMGFLGFFDDQLGTHDVKGYRGHLTALFGEKRLTTGGFKAFFGVIIAFLFSIGTAFLLKTGWMLWEILINFLLVCLAANTINLFDLRPGRAGKIFISGFIIIILFSRNFEGYIGLFLPILAIMLYYLPFDLRAEVMLGDTGSNLLGASLGMMMAWMLGDLGKIIAVLILVGLQLIAEKYSFTEIIERYHWLKYLDELGRKKNNQV